MHYETVKGILSPTGGMNLYRGCTHGCIYCDARSHCYQIKHDFEDVAVKENALELLEEALRKRRKPCMIKTGAMSDPYIPIEKDLEYTRRSLELIHKYNYGVSIQTKSTLILRDLDLILAIHKQSKAVVQMTLTTYDEELCKILEPNVATTRERVEALKVFAAHGIPTVVWLTPILPFINDTEENLLGILEYCREVGVYAILNFYFGVTLREGDREYFYKQLDKYFPGLKDKYHKTYGLSYEIISPNRYKLNALFYSECKKHGIQTDIKAIFSYMDAYEQPNAPIQEKWF